jgi:hypothetical protein
VFLSSKSVEAHVRSSFIRLGATRAAIRMARCIISIGQAAVRRLELDADVGRAG